MRKDETTRQSAGDFCFERSASMNGQIVRPGMFGESDVLVTSKLRAGRDELNQRDAE